MRNVKMVSHPENATVHKLLDARSHKGCIVAGSNPVLTTKKLKVMKKFEDLEFDKISDEPFMSGVRSRMMFENGYGVSVVSHTYSYGGKDGLFEIAVLDKKGELTYKTPVTNDVIGYLKPEEVTEIMEHVQKL
jgi:hypothetical protein